MFQKYILLGMIVFLGGCTTFNPATERNELIFISTPEEVAMGVQADQELSSKNKVISGTEEAERLERIGQKVAHVSDRQDFAYHFKLVESEDLNAFTVPGGFIYFYTGLFRKLKTDDQVAAVLAHEIGHCAAKHTVKRFQAALGYNLVSSMMGQVMTAKAPGAASIMSMGANAVAQLAMSAYSRQDESQADHLGIKYLRLSGYNLNAMIEMFEILEQNTHADSTPLILRTHPLTKDRLEAVRKEIEAIEKK